MREKAKAVYTLYKTNRIDLNGVKKAVKNGIITRAEFQAITGMSYV